MADVEARDAQAELRVGAVGRVGAPPASLCAMGADSSSNDSGRGWLGRARPLLQDGAPVHAGHSPQSLGQERHVSPGSQTLSPHGPPSLAASVPDRLRAESIEASAGGAASRPASSASKLPSDPPFPHANPDEDSNMIEIE